MFVERVVGATSPPLHVELSVFIVFRVIRLVILPDAVPIEDLMGLHISGLGLRGRGRRLATIVK